MRFARPWVAVVCLVAPLLAGCQSSGSSFAMKSPSWWRWGKKDPLAESSIASTQPQLPSQTATPTMPSHSYGVPGGTANPYAPPGDSYANAPAGYSPYAPPAAYSGSPSTGLYDTQAGGYPGYASAGPAATGGYPLSDPNAGNTSMQGQYYNPDYARPSTPDPYAYSAAGAASAPGSTPSYPDYNAPGSMMGSSPVAAASAPSASNPYASPESANAYASAYTADARASTAGAYDTAPTTAYPQVPDPMASQQYGAPPASGYTADPSGFQPGNTGYTPADGGYQPPGQYQPYQSPAGGYQMPQGRSDAPYRPGGTSDYPRASKASPSSETSTADAGGFSVSPASYEELMPETAPLHPIGGAMPAQQPQVQPAYLQ